MENDSKQFNSSPLFGVFLFAGIIFGLAIRNNFDIKSMAIAYGLLGGAIMGVLFEGYRFYKFWCAKNKNK